MSEHLAVMRLARLVQARRGTLALREAAAQSEVSAATLSRVERGETPDIATLLRLCRWMNVSPSEALGWTTQGYVEEGLPCRLLLLQAQLLDAVKEVGEIIEGSLTP